MYTRAMVIAAEQHYQNAQGHLAVVASGHGDGDRHLWQALAENLSGLLAMHLAFVGTPAPINFEHVEAPGV